MLGPAISMHSRLECHFFNIILNFKRKEGKRVPVLLHASPSGLIHRSNRSRAEKCNSL